MARVKMNKGSVEILASANDRVGDCSSKIVLPGNPFVIEIMRWDIRSHEHMTRMRARVGERSLRVRS